MNFAGQSADSATAANHQPRLRIYEAAFETRMSQDQTLSFRTVRPNRVVPNRGNGLPGQNNPNSGIGGVKRRTPLLRG